MKVKEESEKVGLKLNIQKTTIMASESITSWPIDGETMETVTDFILGGSKITADCDCSHETGTLAPWKKSYDQPKQHIKKQRYYFTNKGPSSQSYGFSSSHVWMWELDYKEIWVPKHWCFWAVVLEKNLASPLDVSSGPCFQWTWVWANSRSWWWTGRPGMLWSMGSQRVGQDWVTELKWNSENRRCLRCLTGGLGREHLKGIQINFI